jgi:thiamine-monophosphate kinase
MNEFEIIKKYFQTQQLHRQDVILGTGDDCALLKTPSDQLLAISMDTLISGVHFPKDLPAYEIGYKSLAVNLSDLAAMGAEPAWFTCALTLSDFQEQWCKEWAQGLFDLANQYNIQLVGGDLTRGEVLSITIQVHGFVPQKLVLRRDSAKIGDSIYISGKLGYPVSKKYYHHPEPRIKLGLALRGKAHSAIDISDGLMADLSHLLDDSNVGASIYLDKIPTVHPDALTAGDDYELCFTAPNDLALDFSVYDITCIGKIEPEAGLRIRKPDGTLAVFKKFGYQHF